jgi:hypothetical protein
MKGPQMQALASFRRVTAFLPTLSLTSDDGDVTPQLAELTGIVNRLSAHAVAQETAQRLARASTKQKAALRQVLRVRHMLPISGIAQALLETPSGFGSAVKTPPAKTRTEKLVAAAGGMLAAVRPQETLFVKNGLRADFVVQFQQATAALEAAVAVGAAQKGDRARATAALKQDLRRGKAIVNALNAIVTPAIAHDEGLLAAWRTAKHIERVAVRSPQYLGVYLTTPAGTLALAPTAPAAMTLPGVAVSAVAGASAAVVTEADTVHSISNASESAALPAAQALAATARPLTLLTAG